MPPAPRAVLKNWCFTSYADESPIHAWDESQMDYLIVGKEVCPDTGRDHWQCFVQFKQKKRLEPVKRIFGGNPHCEGMRGTSQEASDYCKKDGDFEERGRLRKCSPQGNGERTDLLEAAQAAQTMTMEELMTSDFAPTVARYMQYFNRLTNTYRNRAGKEAFAKEIADKPLREWQTRLNDVMNDRICPRKVYWFWDSDGGTGKSFMAKYLVVEHAAFLTTGGKMADIAYSYNNERVVVMDLARTQADKMDHMYSLMECFKNGVLFSPKYDSTNKYFETPHVVVFANFEPDRTKLSEDRWFVINLGSRVGF